MAFPNSVINDIVATTLELRSKDIADNVTAHNAALAQMSKKGNVELADGGSEIREHFSFATNGNAGSYSGYDQLPTAAADVLTGAQFSYAQYACPVSFSGLELLKNSGKEQLIDLIKARIDVAESSMQNIINQHMYLDGTGNNGKNLTGLAAAVPLANTTGTYGGIDRSVAANAVWRNKKFQASVDGAGVATSSTLFNQWATFWNTQLVRGVDKPSIILCGPTLFALYESTLTNMMRYSDTETANMGFTNVTFMGCPVVLETTASGIGANDAYFLNTKYLKWRPHKDRNFIQLDDKSPVNQDAIIKTLVFAGNMTCSGAQFQGIYRNT